MKSFGPCSCVLVQNVRKRKLRAVELFSIKSGGVAAICTNLLGRGKRVHSWNLIVVAFDDLWPCNKPSSVQLDIQYIICTQHKLKILVSWFNWLD